MINLLHENILRLSEDNESDRAGIYHVLGTISRL